MFMVYSFMLCGVIISNWYYTYG